MLIVGEMCTVNVLSNPMYNIRMVDDYTELKSHRCIIEVDTHTIYSPQQGLKLTPDHAPNAGEFCNWRVKLSIYLPHWRVANDN